MKNRRDIFILVGLFAALIGFVLISPRLAPPQVEPDQPTARSTEQGGAAALFRWLEALGYAPQRLEYREFALEERDAALFILNPTEEISPDQADDMLAWVAAGGTLILADDATVAFSAPNALLDRLDVRFEVYTTTAAFEQPIQQATPRQPVLNAPLVETALVNTGRMIVAPERPDLVPLLGSDDATVLAGLKQGRGYIYLSTATYPFTNAGLRDPGNAALALNLLRRVPAGGRIQFDEYHLGYYEPPSTTSLVFGSPLGWAASYALLAVVLYLILSGRRFGRPVPLMSELARRSSAEYVTSMADLFQRGGKRAYIASHFYSAFKRRLARGAGITPIEDDAAFVRELARQRPLDERTLADLLARLRTARSDDALIAAVREAEAFS
ncbi:MAG: DUF4350 domain-containing protein, partial [Roseiflexaceae bacterium]|nr:DUF4350 domain-containing protein [Roseiflexaceae bacterium]